MNFKSLTEKEIKEIWVRQEEFLSDPYLHQKISILFGLEKDRVGFFHDVGVGELRGF